jgi:hypothetical protein
MIREIYIWKNNGYLLSSNIEGLIYGILNATSDYMQDNLRYGYDQYIVVKSKLEKDDLRKALEELMLLKEII